MKYKHLRTKILLTLLSASILLVMVTESYHYYMRKDVLFNVSIEKLLILTKTMRNFEKVQLQLYKSRFKKIEYDKKLLDAIDNSNKKNVQIQLNSIAPFLKKASPTLEHIHIYDKNAHFLYSFDKLDSNDQHLEDSNYVLDQATKTMKFSRGYVITKSDGFYRSLVSPLFNGTKLVGYLEFGVRADSLFKISSKAGRYKYALYLKDDFTQKKRKLGKLVSSNSKIFKELNISQEFINNTANKNVLISHNDKYYLFHQYDIESPYQKDFAQVIMATDVTDYVTDNLYKASLMVSLSLFILFILLVIVYMVFTRLINRLTREEEELLTKQTQIQIIMDNSDSLIALIDGENLTLVNKPFLVYLSCTDIEELIHKYNNLSKLFIDSEDTFSMQDAINNTQWISQINNLDENQRIISLKHTLFGVNYFSVKITKDPEHPDSKIIMFSNITSIFKKSKKDEYMAYHDNLTSIYNRQYFNEAISRTIYDLEKKSSNASLLMLDLDFFKNVNDTYGHQVGDEVLIKFTQTITENIRNNDIFARWGGEEFVLLLNNTDEETAYKVAQTLRERISQVDYKEARNITCSIGLSQFKEGDSTDYWLSRADKALYKAKENGRNRVEIV